VARGKLMVAADEGKTGLEGSMPPAGGVKGAMQALIETCSGSCCGTKMCGCRAVVGTMLPTGPSGKAWKFLKLQCNKWENWPPKADVLAPGRADCYLRTTLGQQCVIAGSIWWRVQ
jgi:hypothetical protein